MGSRETIQLLPSIPMSLIFFAQFAVISAWKTCNCLQLLVEIFLRLFCVGFCLFLCLLWDFLLV